MIIINGANYANAEIEAVAEKVTGVARSFTAACGVNIPGSEAEELAIFFSPLQRDRNSLSAVIQNIRIALTKLLTVFRLLLKKYPRPRSARFNADNWQAAWRQVNIMRSWNSWILSAPYRTGFIDGYGSTKMPFPQSMPLKPACMSFWPTNKGWRMLYRFSSKQQAMSAVCYSRMMH